MSATFDPTRYLKPLNGKQYLEVVHRVQWIRSEHPNAIITTHLQHVDFEAGWAIFHARVEIPGAGIAEGTGSETRQNFPAGWLEKAETIAIGRALAALGYGTAFCLDFETAETGNGHLADSPVEQPATATTTAPEPIRLPANADRMGATGAQLKMIYLTGTKDLHLDEETVDERCHEIYGTFPLHLTKRQASEFIDTMKRAANGTARAAAR